MNKVEFIYNNDKYFIQCNNEDKMKDIIDKYLIKIGKNKKNIYFLYNGQIINEELTFNKCSNSLDRSRNNMSLLVLEGQESNEGLKYLIKSNNIICPECNEYACISINNFKITIWGCKCGHETKDLQLDEFLKTQYKDLSKIKCEKCGKLKSDINENKFYTCYTCDLNLCPGCKDTHIQSHNINDYEENPFYCKLHFDKYEYYCCDCKKDICTLC